MLLSFCSLNGFNKELTISTVPTYIKLIITLLFNHFILFYLVSFLYFVFKIIFKMLNFQKIFQPRTEGLSSLCHLLILVYLWGKHFYIYRSYIFIFLFLEVIFLYFFISRSVIFIYFFRSNELYLISDPIISLISSFSPVLYAHLHKTILYLVLAIWNVQSPCHNTSDF